ncbi:erythromycin esterase family protein [Streptomyces sp. bgisy100]|uniref:erythromycin esterase family protein n=1 Tax=Streptomyces sp. bgisy100 TaxID=3413783 RepID=UPI003D72BCF6
MCCAARAIRDRSCGRSSRSPTASGTTANTADGGDGTYRRFTVGPAAPGSNEHTLDRVRHRDYLLDQRTAAPAARNWLATARPTLSIGTVYPELSKFDIPLLPSHDVLIHLHRVTAAGLLPE